MGTLEKLQFADADTVGLPRHAALRRGVASWLLFGAASASAGGNNARFLGHNLSCFLVYIWARTYEGQEVAVMEFFTIRAELLPSVWKSLRRPSST